MKEKTQEELEVFCVEGETLEVVNSWFKTCIDNYSPKFIGKFYIRFEARGVPYEDYWEPCAVFCVERYLKEEEIKERQKSQEEDKAAEALGITPFEYKQYQNLKNKGIIK